MKMPPSFVWPLVPPTFLRPLALASALFLAGLPAHAEDPKPQPPAAMMREVGPGLYELGKMRLDKNAASLTFPGKINMKEGMLEYLICSPQGSTHESLLVSEVRPTDLHFAMLLLGAKGAGIRTPAPEDAPPSQIDAEYLKKAPELKGDVITITARYKNKEGKEITTAVEDWILNESTKQAAPRGPWSYTGSMFYEKDFLAEVQGNIASLVTNPAALINNPRNGNTNDKTWIVNEKTVPPVDTPLEITITLQPAPAPAK